VKQSEILKAEGDAQARVTRSTAEAKAIEMISTAAETFFKERAEVSKRLDVLNNVLAQQAKYVVPTGSELGDGLGLDGKNGVPAQRWRARAETERGGPRERSPPRCSPAASVHARQPGSPADPCGPIVRNARRGPCVGHSPSSRSRRLSSK